MIKSMYGILCMGIFFSCTNQNSNKNQNAGILTILISKDEDKAFENWLNQTDSTINYVDVYALSLQELEIQLNKSAGILIAGGNDVNAQIYGKESEKERCGDFDLQRDTMELKMIEYALKNKVPLLCVCRGEQIFNVSQGGSLIIDIPTDIGPQIDHSGKKQKQHLVYINPKSLLYEIVKLDSANVNSLHHQAVENLANNLIIGAKAKDDITESIELKDKNLHPFALGVQWHPELLEQSDPMAKPIAERFLKEVTKYRKIISN